MIISYKFHTQLKKKDKMHLDILLCSIVFYLLRISVFELNENSKHFVKRKLQP